MAQAGAPPVVDVFGALAHPARRALIERLAEGERRASDLADGLAVSRPAVSQHLRIMLDVGVVRARRRGREHLYRLERHALDDVRDWLGRVDVFWSERLDALAELLDEDA